MLKEYIDNHKKIFEICSNLGMKAELDLNTKEFLDKLRTSLQMINVWIEYFCLLSSWILSYKEGEHIPTQINAEISNNYSRWIVIEKEIIEGLYLHFVDRKIGESLGNAFCFTSIVWMRNAFEQHMITNMFDKYFPSRFDSSSKIEDIIEKYPDLQDHIILKDRSVFDYDVISKLNIILKDVYKEDTKVVVGNVSLLKEIYDARNSQHWCWIDRNWNIKSFSSLSDTINLILYYAKTLENISIDISNNFKITD